MSDIIFHQLFEPTSSTYTYLLADSDTREAILIDSVQEMVERDLKLIEEMGLKLLYVLDTHVHADHITGAGEIRKKTGAKSGVSACSKVPCVDIPLVEGQELRFGSHVLKVIATPGHTDGCLSFLVGNKVFTGDSLMIRTNGRTDFQAGSPETLYESITQKLFKLPDNTLVYPGHDYKGLTSSTIGLEKKFNVRIGAGRSKEDFIKIMKELKLPDPKRMKEAVPANMQCGGKMATFKPTMNSGIPEITAETLHANLSKAKMVDVRRPDEFTGELGHIAGAKLVTLGPDFVKYLETADKTDEIVFVCRSGNRSGEACDYSRRLGFTNTINLAGGMLRWNDLKYPVEK